MRRVGKSLRATSVCSWWRCSAARRCRPLAQAPAGNQAPAAGSSEDWVKRLAGLETAPDLDVPALRHQATERVKSRADKQSLKRPLVAPQLLKLPQLVAEINFDDDAAVVRPDSYRVLGRIADTLTHPSLLGYKFLIVGHTVSTGRRDVNLTLSQRRADVIREVLINTFKITPEAAAVARSRRGATAGQRPPGGAGQPAGSPHDCWKHD